MASKSTIQSARPALTQQQDDALLLCKVVLGDLIRAGGGPLTPEQSANMHFADQANPDDCQDSKMTLDNLVSAGLVTVEGRHYSLRPCFLDWPVEKMFTVWAALMTREVWSTRPNLLDYLLWQPELPDGDAPAGS